MKKEERSIEIDRLRGIAMLAIILIHTNAYFLTNKTAHFLWDSNEFAVPVFIFCSFYLFLKKRVTADFAFIRKRFLRLLIPYWTFLLFYLPLILINEPAQKIPKSIFQYTTLTTPSNDLSWLVLLFLMLTLIGLFINYLLKQNRTIFYIFLFFSFICSLFFVFYQPPFNQKLIMWLPWSLIMIWTLYFVKNDGNKRFLFWSTILFGLIYLGLWITESRILNHSLAQYDNKYPPNLYHLSYGILWITGLYYLAKSRLFEFFPLKNLLDFLSVNSYSIYFIHFLLVIYIGIYHWQQFPKWGWFGFFTIVFFLTLAIQSVILRLRTSVFRR